MDAEVSEQAAGRFDADTVLAAALTHYGLPAGAVTLRRNVSSTYRLEHAPLVVRVTELPDETARLRLLAENRLVEWLHRQGFPTLPIADEYPLLVGARFAVRVSHALDTAPVTVGQDMGHLLAEFHRLCDRYPHADELPEFEVIDRLAGRVRRPLPQFADAVAPVRDTVDRLLADPPASALGWGLIHADSYPNNFLRDRRSGQLRLIDFELACRGSREWDLMYPWVAAERMGAGDWDAFCAGYGHDPLDGPDGHRWRQLALAQASAWWVSTPGLPARWYAEGLARLAGWPDAASRWVEL